MPDPTIFETTDMLDPTVYKDWQIAENAEKKRELWNYIRQRSRVLYLKMRYGGLGNLVYIPGKSGRYITIGTYKLVQKIYRFN